MYQKLCATTDSWVPTVLRVVAGVIFLAHGWQKLGGLNFAGMEQTVGFFAMMGLPAFVAWLVALGELVGGALLILGLATRAAAAWLALIMLGAIVTVHLKNGLIASGGYEYPLMLLAVQIVLLQLGAGAWSVDGKTAGSANVM